MATDITDGSQKKQHKWPSYKKKSSSSSSKKAQVIKKMNIKPIVYHFCR